MTCEQKQSIEIGQEWIELYQSLFPMVAAWIGSRGGNLEEARDIFQETVLDYFEKNRLEENFANKLDRPYIMAIAKNKWYKYYNSRKLEKSLEDLKAGIHIASEDQAPVEEKMLMKYLSIAGQNCMKLLSAYYYRKLKMSAIASQFGFSGARSATVQKHKCLEKVKKAIHQKSLAYEDFLG